MKVFSRLQKLAAKLFGIALLLLLILPQAVYAADGSIYIWPGRASLQAGDSYQFTAEVTYSGDQTVTWSIEGNTSSETVIDNTGRLTVAADETAKYIDIHAVLNADSSITEKYTSTAYVVSEPPVVEIRKVYRYQDGSESVTLYPGDEDVCFAASYGGTQEDSTTTWTLTGNSSANTKITGFSQAISGSVPTVGVTVGDDETSSSITLTATSVVDPSVSKSLVITIQQIREITTVALSMDESIWPAFLSTSVTEETAQTVLRNNLEAAADGFYINTLNYRNLQKLSSGSWVNAQSSANLTTEDQYSYYIMLNCSAGYSWPASKPALTLNGTPLEVYCYYVTGQYVEIGFKLPTVTTDPVYVVNYVRSGHALGTVASVVQTSSTFTVPTGALFTNNSFDHHYAGWSLESATATDSLITTETVTLSPGATNLYEVYEPCTFDAFESKGKNGHIKVCSVCGEFEHPWTYYNHVWAETVSAETLKSGATCESAAVYYKTCSVCGYISETETFTSGDPKAHSASAYQASDTEHWQVCDTCGNEVEGSRAAHTFTDGKCTVCGYVSYKVTKGDGQTYTLKSGSTLGFTCNGALADFTELKVDDNVVSASDYAKASGSTIVTLSSAYLDTLSAGTHTIKFVYAEAESDTASFTVEKAPEENKNSSSGSSSSASSESSSANSTADTSSASTASPKTGDYAYAALWLALAAAAGCAVTAVIRRKNS